MTVRVELNGEERERLKQTFKHTTDQRLRERCQAVLIAARGRRRRQIAGDLSVIGPPCTAGCGRTRRGGAGHSAVPQPRDHGGRDGNARVLSSP